MNGSNGQDGADGTDGADGAALTRQARCNGCPISSGTADTPVPVPLTNGTWTQATDEGNVLFFEVTMSGPAGSCTAGVPPAGAQVQVKLDGNVVATVQRLAGSGSSTTQALAWYVFAPGSAQGHTLTAEIADNCTGGENGEVTQVKVDVASALG